MPTGVKTAKPERWQVVFRLARDLIGWVDQRAVEEGFVMPSGKPNRARMLRLIVVYARTMPRGWRP